MAAARTRCVLRRCPAAAAHALAAASQLAPPRAVAAPEKRARVRTLSIEARAPRGACLRPRSEPSCAHAAPLLPRGSLPPPQDLAVAYYLAAPGGGAAERLQREGDASARCASAAAAPGAPAAPAFVAAAGRLTVRFRGIRTALEERVQALSREEVLALLRALLARGGSSARRGAAAHLLAPREMAARSPTAFWNAVRWFGGAEAAARAAQAEVAGGAAAGEAGAGGDA